MVASPPSTLLPPGQHTLALSLRTSVPTACKWAATDAPFSSMNQTFSGSGDVDHSTVLFGLSGGLALSVFYVRCEAFPSSPALVLSYRSLPDSDNAPFPRLGNLWGSSNFYGHPQGLAYAANRSSLWLGARFSGEEIAQLRGNNSYSLVLTSINACETNDQDLPDDFYLLNVTQPNSTLGRLQSWPGAWRLDLTNPRVQQYQAALMYCLVVFGGSGYGSDPTCNNATIPPLLYDGLFVDNVFMDDGQGVNSQDIFHNPFTPINQSTGEPFADFNAAWHDGMVAMLSAARQLHPSMVLSGHAMDVSDGNITALFNAISIGFTAPLIVEGRAGFEEGLATYQDWLSLPLHQPRVTMVESAVRLALGYGYGFDSDLETLIPRACINSHTSPDPLAPMPGIGSACQPTAPQAPGYLPPQTYLLARSEYQYFRFGLGFTLLGDGYFTHELGDSWHGMDWDYDELHFSLGLPLGEATPAAVVSPSSAPIPPSLPLNSTPWGLWVENPSGANASLTMDASQRPSPASPPSARVDIAATAQSSAYIDLSLVLPQLPSGGYRLSFFARASCAPPSAPLSLNARQDGGDWHGMGLDARVSLTREWVLYNATFASTGGGLRARLSWWLGSVPGGCSVWVNSPALDGVALPQAVLTREFECGVVVVNGERGAPNATVAVGNTTSPGSAFSRLLGTQAPRWQYFVDDAGAGFSALSGGPWVRGDFDSGYHWSTTPTQEEVRPPHGFFHHWGVGAHTAPGGSSAQFHLGVPQGGAYNVSLWWPAAVPARLAWARAARVSINPGGVALVLDFSTQGGDQFLPIALGAQLDPTSVLVIECPEGGGGCVADAVLVESAARWNDGSEAPQVTLSSMDAIVLAKTAGAPQHCPHLAK